jgi:hypothetical protein
LTTIASGTTTSLDMRLLAQAVLDGDSTAALALADLVTEQWNSGERLSLIYVERIEEFLQLVRSTLFRNRIDHVTCLYKQDSEGAAVQTLSNCVVLRDWEVDALSTGYFKLEQLARSLNRQNLS